MPGATVHQLKITLRDVKPPVWRRLLVPSNWSLAKVSPVLEAAMGWYGGHLHAFEAAGRRYGRPDPDWDMGLVDERKARLGDVLSDVKSKMQWEYDFGDGWEHDVVVEEILDADPMMIYPVCVTGRRACPPDDCGGSWGYANLLAVLADPTHPEHEELSEWIPPRFDPAVFDLEGTNHWLRQIR